MTEDNGMEGNGTAAGSTGVGSTGVGSTGVRSTGVRSTGVRSTGVGSTGVRSTGVRSTGVRSTGVGSTVTGREWIAGLPGELFGQRALLDGLLGICAADPVIRYLLIGCSLGRGAADSLSDLDAGMGVAADGEEFEAVWPRIHAAVAGLNGLVDSFSHRLPEVAARHVRIFAQYADRCQLDLVVLPAAPDVRVPNAVALHDPDGLVTAAAPDPPPSPAEVREWAFLGWAALADLGKYLRRGSAWEALARLNDARAQCWKVMATADRVPQARYGITSILDFAPGAVPAAMAGTVAGLDLADLLAAGRRLAGLLTATAARLDEPARAAQPAEMGRFITADLDRLAADWDQAEPG
jgi:hypothetical protein